MVAESLEKNTLPMASGNHWLLLGVLLIVVAGCLVGAILWIRYRRTKKWEALENPSSGAGDVELYSAEMVSPVTEDLTEVSQQLQEMKIQVLEDICFCESGEIIP